MVFRQDFVIIMTMIGIISLAGVVVNNAIVLIDYTNLLIDRRKAELGSAKTTCCPSRKSSRSLSKADGRACAPCS